MKSLLVIGGQQRALRPLRTGSQSWYEYQQGVVLRIEPESNTVETVLEYVSPSAVCAQPDPTILFKGGVLEHNKLYLCTPTEVLIFAYPTFEQIGYLSLPSFNDVHHVRPTPRDTLLITNTGLDMVIESTQTGTVLREWNVLREDPWDQFSRFTDYRKISTKPHHAHPNYSFLLDDEVWTTRFEQRDTICLTQPGQQIPLNIERPHDGVLCDGLLYFTTVNGSVVIADPQLLRVREVIDLTEMHDRRTLLGWCRGLSFDGRYAWIGFSRLRPTRARDNVSWVRSGFRSMMPTHISCYDLRKRSCIMTIDVEAHGLNAVFSICTISS